MRLITSYADTALTISLSSLRHNWRLINDYATEAVCAAVVKADAYGLGINQAAPALYEEGCRHFFVATLDEAIHLRSLLPEPTMIAVFNGVRAAQESIFAEYHLTPILNNL